MYAHITPGEAISGVTITGVYSTLCRKLKSWVQLQISLWDTKKNAGFKFLFFPYKWKLINCKCYMLTRATDWQFQSKLRLHVCNEEGRSMNFCTESFNSTNSLLKLNIFNSFLHKNHYSPSVSSSSTRVCSRFWQL